LSRSPSIAVSLSHTLSHTLSLSLSHTLSHTQLEYAIRLNRELDTEKEMMSAELEKIARKGDAVAAEFDSLSSKLAVGFRAKGQGLGI